MPSGFFVRYQFITYLLLIAELGVDVVRDSFVYLLSFPASCDCLPLYLSCLHVCFFLFSLNTLQMSVAGLLVISDVDGVPGACMSVAGLLDCDIVDSATSTGPTPNNMDANSPGSIGRHWQESSHTDLYVGCCTLSLSLTSQCRQCCSSLTL